MERRVVTDIRESDVLIEALVDLVSGARVNEVLSQVVRTASCLVDAPDGFLAVVDADDRVVEVVELDGRPAALPGLIPGRVPATPGERWMSSHSGTSVPSIDGFALVVPIVSRRGFRADLYLADRDGDRSFTEGERALLTMFASVAGAVIDRAQLHEEAHQRELWVILQGEIATSLLAGVPIERVLDSVARGARELTQADVSTVLLRDGPLSLQLGAADGQGIRRLVGDSCPTENTISGQIVETGEPVILSDIEPGEPSAEPLLSVGGIRHALFVPLISNNCTVGTLAVGRFTGSRPLTQTDFWLLESFASQVSVALEYGRARGELERLAVVEDQERIARDLHDTVIQQIFATGMSLQATAQRTTDPRTAERIQGAVDCLDSIIRDIRTAVFALNTTGLDDGSIRGALRDVVAQMLESSELTVDVHLDGPVETAIDEEVRKHVIATVREALSNVNRHAKAERVDIFLYAGSELILRIVDNGVGIDAPPQGHKGGLSNLKARAEGLGGQMTLSRPAAGGTAIEWRVPWGHRVTATTE